MPVRSFVHNNIIWWSNKAILLRLIFIYLIDNWLFHIYYTLRLHGPWHIHIDDWCHWTFILFLLLKLFIKHFFFFLKKRLNLNFEALSLIDKGNRLKYLPIINSATRHSTWMVRHPGILPWARLTNVWCARKLRLRLPVGRIHVHSRVIIINDSLQMSKYVCDSYIYYYITTRWQDKT